MSWIRRLRSLFEKQKLEDQLDQELQFHIEMRMQESIAAGMTPEEAGHRATRLFGNDPRRKQFLKTVAHQQGLLQIYEDFCMQDNSDCAQCPFPEQMKRWT